MQIYLVGGISWTHPFTEMPNDALVILTSSNIKEGHVCPLHHCSWRPCRGEGTETLQCMWKVQWYFYVTDCIWLKDPEMSQVSLSSSLTELPTQGEIFQWEKKIILNYCLGQCLISQNRTILYKLSWSKSSLGLRLKWGSLLIPKPEPTSRDLLTIQPNTRVQGSCGQHYQVWCPEWPERQGAETGLHAETWVLSTQRTHHKQEESS